MGLYLHGLVSFHAKKESVHSQSLSSGCTKSSHNYSEVDNDHIVDLQKKNTSAMASSVLAAQNNRRKILSSIQEKANKAGPLWTWWRCQAPLKKI